MNKDQENNGSGTVGSKYKDKEDNQAQTFWNNNTYKHGAVGEGSYDDI